MRTVHSESSIRNGSTATRRVSNAPSRGASCICTSISKGSATGGDLGFSASFVYVTFSFVYYAEMLKCCTMFGGLSLFVTLPGTLTTVSQKPSIIIVVSRFASMVEQSLCVPFVSCMCDKAT